MTVQGFLQELYFMGYRNSRLSSVRVQSTTDNRSILVEIHGFTRLTKLSPKEVQVIETKKIPGLTFYVERKLLGLRLWKMLL